MKKLKNFLLFILVVTVYSCESDGLSDSGQNLARDVKTLGDLEFTYQVTDMEGNPESKFTEGENFILSFVVKNLGNEDVAIAPWDFPIVIDDFFAVYKKRSQGNEEILIGKSFTLGANSKDLPSQTVAAKEEIEYRIPWLTQKDTSYVMPLYRPDTNEYNKRSYRAVEPLTEPLLAGQYYSGFNLDHQGEEISFDVKFVIK